jgi:hypothetical protein
MTRVQKALTHAIPKIERHHYLNRVAGAATLTPTEIRAGPW